MSLLSQSWMSDIDSSVFLDVLELGAPFTDPIADGPTIQTANTVRKPN